MYVVLFTVYIRTLWERSETVAVIRQQSRSFACRAIVTCFVHVGNSLLYVGNSHACLKATDASFK